MNDDATATSELNFSPMVQSDGSVLLEWLATVDAPGQWFRLESGTDGQHFEPLGKMPAGEKTGSWRFMFIDQHPSPGVNWYRLTQLDAHSNALRVKTGQVTVAAPANAWTLYPNPVASGGALHIAAQKAGTYSFRLFNGEGKIVLNEAGTGNTTLQLPALPSGTYGYEISDGKHRTLGAIIIK